MKKKLLAVSLAAICLSLLAYGTVAYFSTETTATNVITAGNIEIVLKETAVPENGGDPVPFEDVTGVMPGTAVSKIVEVENSGDNDAYIRIRVEKTITPAQGVDAQLDPSLIGLDFDTENWVEKDGYYYYKKPLSSGETTKPLFTTVTFAKSMENIYQDSKADINVYVQAVQADNNGEDPAAALGWPAEEGGK